MKIVYDYQIFLSQRYGGISRYFYELAQSLVVHRLADVEIFCPFYQTEYFSAASSISPSGKKIVGSRSKIRALKILCESQAFARLRFDKNYDVFHQTYYSRFTNARPSSLKVVTVYDMIHEKFPQFFPEADRTRERKRLAVDRSDHVICISENTKADLISFLGVDSAKISVVYLGHSLNETIDPSNTHQSERPFILYVGDRGGYKNFVGLLSAYKNSWLCREFDLIAFGGGDFTDEEKDQIGSLKDRVYQKFGSDSILAGLYRSAAVMVYPSLYEGFGIPPLEAMGYGCPVACSNVSSIPEVVGDSAELFDPYSQSEIGAAIEKIVSSSEYAQRLIERGQVRAAEFSWEKCAQQTLKVYELALGR